MEISLSIQPLTIVVPKEREYLYNTYKDHLKALDKIARTHEDLAIRFQAVELLVMVGRAMAGLLDASEDQKLDEEIRKFREKLEI